jgi:hypothetical protein
MHSADFSVEKSTRCVLNQPGSFHFSLQINPDVAQLFLNPLTQAGSLPFT